MNFGFDISVNANLYVVILLFLPKASITKNNYQLTTLLALDMIADNRLKNIKKMFYENVVFNCTI